MFTSARHLSVRSLLTGAVLTVCLGVSARVTQRSAEAPLPAEQRTLVVARDLSDTRTLDPDRLFEPSAAVVAGNIYETLVTVHGETINQPRPMLATHWTISPNNRVFTFYLRRGVRFSTGDPLTAADVVFSYRRLGYLNDNPAFLIGARSVGKRVVIDQVRAIGAYTVRFTLPSPNVSFLAALTTPTFGVVDAKTVRAHGGRDAANAAVRDRATGWLNGHSAGSGPFVLSSWIRGGTGQIVLKRNPYFRGPRPYLNQIIFQGIPSATTQRLEVDRGSVDIASNIDIDGAKTLRGSPNVSVITGNSLDLIYLAMTTNSRISQPLSNIKVREAIRAALDYNGTIRGLLSGIGTQPNSMIPLGLVGNDRATNDRLKLHTNLLLARRLMRQAGYPNGFNITMQYPSGFTLDGVSYDVLAPKVAHDLEKIGIKVTLVARPLSVLLPAWRAGRQSFILWGWVATFPDPNDNALAFASGGFNARHVGYDWDVNASRLAASADATSNAGARAALYGRIQQIWLNEGPWAAMVQPRGIVVLHHGVTNFQFSPMFTDSLSFVRKT